MTTAKKTYWTKVLKPQIEATLNKMDAPKEWKKGMLKLEKGINTARNLVASKGWQAGIESMDKYYELCRFLGMPDMVIWASPNDKYWRKYAELQGLVYRWNIGDALC